LQVPEQGFVLRTGLRFLKFGPKIDQVITITVSAAVAVVYTLVGGMYSVAYTDVIQVNCGRQIAPQNLFPLVTWDQSR
jgi:hypothetical protein